jgi:DNA-binding MarR family transcriptional regulator
LVSNCGFLTIVWVLVEHKIFGFRGKRMDADARPAYCIATRYIISMTMKRNGSSANLSSVSKADYKLLASFRHALREFVHFSEEASRVAGVPPHQHQAMLAIAGVADRGRITVGKLAEQLQIKHQSTVGLVNRMEAKGLVKKTHDPIDKRQVFLGLTPAGERMLKSLSAAHKAEIARISPVLKKILNNLNLDS